MPTESRSLASQVRSQPLHHSSAPLMAGPPVPPTPGTQIGHNVSMKRPKYVPPHNAGRRSMPSPTRAPMMAVAAAIGVVLLPACSEPGLTAEPYRGPQLSLRSFNDKHAAVMTAPSKGWRVQLDRTLPTIDGEDIYLTITRPDPQFVYPQVIVEQQVLTDLDATIPARIAARVKGVRDDSEPDYSIAVDQLAESAATQRSPAPEDQTDN